LNGLHPADVVGRRIALAARYSGAGTAQCACTNYFDYCVKARTDIKAFAWNREGHCSSVTFRRTIDEAKEEAMRECTKAWKECSLYAAGQALAPG
jgi:hypothetical protein